MAGICGPGVASAGLRIAPPIAPPRARPLLPWVSPLSASGPTTQPEPAGAADLATSSPFLSRGPQGRHLRRARRRPGVGRRMPPDRPHLRRRLLLVIPGSGGAPRGRPGRAVESPRALPPAPRRANDYGWAHAIGMRGSQAVCCNRRTRVVDPVWDVTVTL
jgi:hypothetical protein